jgi:hypothetical protein
MSDARKKTEGPSLLDLIEKIFEIVDEARKPVVDRSAEARALADIASLESPARRVANSDDYIWLDEARTRLAKARGTTIEQRLAREKDASAAFLKEIVDAAPTILTALRALIANAG